MTTIIILGSKDSGKKTLKEKLCSRLPQFRFDVYSGGILPSCTVAILVVSLTDGPQAETVDHLCAAQKSKIPKILCFLNKSDIVREKFFQELVALECKGLGEEYGYSGEKFLILSGSALQNKDIDNLTQQIRPGYKCKSCEHIEPAPFEICRVCHTKQKVQFWKKLFGF